MGHGENILASFFAYPNNIHIFFLNTDLYFENIFYAYSFEAKPKF